MNGTDVVIATTVLQRTDGGSGFTVCGWTVVIPFPATSSLCLDWTDCIPATSSLCLDWTDCIPVTSSLCVDWTDAIPATASLCVDWTDVVLATSVLQRTDDGSVFTVCGWTVLQISLCVHWTDAIPATSSLCVDGQFFRFHCVWTGLMLSLPQLYSV